MKYKNKNNGKVVTVIKMDESYVWFKIDGIETVVAKLTFEKVYNKLE